MNERVFGMGGLLPDFKKSSQLINLEAIIITTKRFFRLLAETSYIILNPSRFITTNNVQGCRRIKNWFNLFFQFEDFRSLYEPKAYLDIGQPAYLMTNDLVASTLPFISSTMTRHGPVQLFKIDFELQVRQSSEATLRSICAFS